MPTYILIKAIDGFNPENPLTRNAGFPIHAMGSSQIGGKQIPPKFIQVEIPDEDDYQAIYNSYCVPWMRVIDWEFIGHDYSIDGHRLRIFVKPEYVSASGINSIDYSQAAAYLQKWNASIFESSQNSITFDALVYEAIKSQGFWNGYIAYMIDWTELDYNQTTGIHRVQADYSESDLVNLSESQINEYVEKRGATIVSHADNVVIFDIHRTAVFNVFKISTKSALEKKYSNARFKLPESYIPTAPTDPQDPKYGTIVINRVDIPTVMYDRLND